MKTILFQGDSITDAGRNRENSLNRGIGYATMVSGKLGAEHPGKYEFLNRGIGGNRVVDLYARLKADFINLKPDFISILIGVNDVWHEISRQNGVEAKKFEKVYGMLIEELQEALPQVKIMILEPFVLEGSATLADLSRFQKEVGLRQEGSKAVADKYRLPFVPLQEKMNQACFLASAEYWLYDGVHPTAAGHYLIAEQWLKTFQTMV